MPGHKLRLLSEQPLRKSEIVEKIDRECRTPATSKKKALPKKNLGAPLGRTHIFPF